MGKPQTSWARRKRDELFSTLGRVCIICGATKDLEFDVIKPVGNNDHHRRMSWDQRMRFYSAQLKKGNLQVLCSRHNGKKRATEEAYLSLYQPPKNENEPF